MIDLSVPDSNLYKSADLTSYTSSASKESFSYIFFDNINYISHLYKTGRMRDVTYKNVLDTILCGSIYLGFDSFECPHCGYETVIPHTCKSRFCPKCAAKMLNRKLCPLYNCKLY